MGARSAAIAVIAAIGCVACATPHAAALEKVKMSLAAASSNYAPYFNAIEQGYFKEEGLDVEIVKAGGGVATPALIAGSMGFSTSSASAFSAILKGAPLKVILTEADRPTYQLWTTSDDLKTIQSLKGKTVGIQTRGDTFEIWMRLVLKSHHMSGDDVSYTPLGYGNSARLAAVKAGSLPAVVLSSLDVSALKEAGVLTKGHMLEDAMKDDIRMPYNGVATSDAMIKGSPDTVARFIRATVKGMRFMTAFKDKTIANVMKYNNEDRHSTEVDYDDVVRTLTKDGAVSTRVQQAEAEIRAELVKLPKDKIPPLKDMFDFSFVHKANSSLDAQGWKPSL
jgi:ABC-type nitrate/sulfonate/bicarbonate transport system substrate-binding protein